MRVVETNNMMLREPVDCGEGLDVDFRHQVVHSFILET